MGRPKALIEWRGQSFLRRVVSLAEACACRPIIVVEGAIPLPDAELGSALRVVNEEWSKGQLSSLQRGLAALSEDISGVMVLAIDRPRVGLETCKTLAAAHRRESDAIWQPAVHRRRGHPILYPRRVFEELVALPSDEGPRSWLRSPKIEALRRSVEVQDPGIFENFDRPQDLSRLG